MLSLVTAAGCGGQYGPSTATANGMPPAESAARRFHSWISPEVKHARNLLYVADPTGEPSYTGVIDIITVNGLKYKLLGQIQDDDDPDGMTTDAYGNLYVTDEGVATEGPAPGEIKVYPKGSTSYSRLIQPANWIPFDIAVSPNGTMYVANIAPLGYFNPGSVSIYPPQASQPSRVLRLPNFQVYGITRHNNTSTIYISYAPEGSEGRIAEFVHARGKAIQLGVSYSDPWGILEDGNDNLLACDGSGTIEVYAEATGKLVQQISVPSGCMWLAFNQQRTRLYVSNFDQVEILSYPGGAALGTINEAWSTQNYPTGVAYWPPPQ
jgi:sugar lactone lactonase YvrE